MSLYDSLLDRMNGTEYSGYFSACCPFHNDSHPSLFVYSDGFRCASCGERGALQKLDEKVRRGFFHRDTVSVVLPRWKKWEREYGGLEGIADFAHESLLKSRSHRKYFEERQCEKFIKAGRLGYLSGWAVIPVFERDQHITNIVVRAVSRKGNSRYVISPISVDDGSDSHRPLYCPNWKRVEGSDLIYVVYGIFDAISLELAGLPVVTGITGKSLSSDLIEPMRKRVVILPDKGEERDAHRLANDLGWRATVKELDFPDGAKDPDDIRRIYGNDYLKEMIC